jgi:hypothetical protein
VKTVEEARNLIANIVPKSHAKIDELDPNPGVSPLSPCAA